jgi:SAM-dependent methyltransferase
VASGGEWKQDERLPAATPRTAVPRGIRVEPEYLRGWAADNGSRDYIEHHIDRLEKTLEITPPGGPDDRILEMGAYLQITPALKTRLGYGEVRGCYYGEAGKVDHHVVRSDAGEEFVCDVDLFNAEKDCFPYEAGHFSTVLCCELIEHLSEDPMHMMAEINRILKPGGHLVLTTPNIASMRAIVAIVEGYHPGFFPAYIRPAPQGEETEARHNREYTPKEIAQLVADAGFDLVRLETGPFKDVPKPEHAWAAHMLERYKLSTDLRGDGIYAVARKTGPVRRRYPAWLYEGGDP